MRLLAIIAVFLFGVTSLSAAGRWAQFRGPGAGVVANDPALPDTWGPNENIAWKISIPGRGWSSPIVWDNHVFVITVISDEPPPTPGLDIIEEGKPVSYAGGMRAPIRASMHRWMLYDFDLRTGKKRWERELRAGEPLAAKHPKNSYASETPVTDGRYVYVYSGDAGLYAVDFKGHIKWSTRVQPPNALPAENPALLRGRIDFGTGSSAALHGDRLYVIDAHEPMQQPWFLAAYSARTGEELWRVVGEKSPQGRPTWNTPFVWQNGQRTEIVILADRAVRSYDLDGKPLWQLRSIGASVPTPYAANGLLYVGSGYPSDATRPLWAVRPGGTGDISLAEGQTRNDYIAWFNQKLTSYIPSSLVYGKYLYSLETQGFMQCVDAVTGDVVYGRKRIDTATSGFSASPWAYNGRIFALSEDGDTYVIQPGPEFKVLRKNSLGEMALATPAVVDRSLIVRTTGSLYCIAKR